MILVIDNYDSFTYNLVHLVARDDAEVRVIRNDQIDVAGIRELGPAGILISPGPGRPDEAGITEDVIHAFGSELPILGVCLGHQAIGEVYGGRVVHAPSLMHGKTSLVHHDESELFEGVQQAFVATRYHSLVLERESLPQELLVSAWTTDGVIMGVRHREHPVEGIQFHPESLLTEAGPRLIRNWMNRVDYRTTIS